MLNNKIILKVSYGGILNYISAERNLYYQDLLKTVLNQFKITKVPLELLQLCDEEGYVFDKNSFEYFITIFPTPHIIFYVKINYKQFIDNTAMDISEEETQNEDTKIHPFSTSRLTNKRKRTEGAPLVRQNCFIGEVPRRRLEFGQPVDYQNSKRRRLAYKKPRSLRI